VGQRGRGGKKKGVLKQRNKDRDSSESEKKKVRIGKHQKQRRCPALRKGKRGI